MSNSKNLVLLGSAGSIGTQTLDVCRQKAVLPGVKITALSAHANIKLLYRQVREFSPEYVVITSGKDYKQVGNERVLYGQEGLDFVCSLPGVFVLNAIVGEAGLASSVACITAGNNLALANKETLVADGARVMELARERGVRIIPVDSEHSAIFQCLEASPGARVRRIILTASGGPFYGFTREELAEVSLADALSHPTWSMGGKVTVDSATLLNKGLELCEAVHLFGVRPDQVEIVIHRQSVIHSAVEFCDGSVIAQMSNPDMRLPIQYALTYPERHPCPVKPLDLFALQRLTFEKPDEETFGCLRIMREAIERGGDAPRNVMRAGEKAVERFLAGEIGFLGIEEACEGAARL